jgi:hypothetical protein
MGLARLLKIHNYFPRYLAPSGDTTADMHATKGLPEPICIFITHSETAWSWLCVAVGIIDMAGETVEVKRRGRGC